MIYTTLNRIRAHSPCKPGWAKLLGRLGKYVSDDEPLPMSQVLTSNGIHDAVWCLRVEPQHEDVWRMLAVHFARRVQMNPEFVALLDKAEGHALGHVTRRELSRARNVAPITGSSADHAATAACHYFAHDAVRDTLYNAMRPGSVLWMAEDMRKVLDYYHAEPGKKIHGWG